MHIPPSCVHPTHVTSPIGLEQVVDVHLMHHREQLRPETRSGWSKPCI
jgi:hypothetical protein